MIHSMLPRIRRVNMVKMMSLRLQLKKHERDLWWQGNVLRWNVLCSSLVWYHLREMSKLLWHDSLVTPAVINSCYWPYPAIIPVPEPHIIDDTKVIEILDNINGELSSLVGVQWQNTAKHIKIHSIRKLQNQLWLVHFSAY